MYSLGYDFVVSSDLTRQTDQVIILGKGLGSGKTRDTMGLFSAIVYIAVWIHVMFDYMNQNREKILCYDSCLNLT